MEMEIPVLPGYDLEVIDIVPDKEQNEFSKSGELWRYDPDQCCKINKVEPFEKARDQYEVWISGLMSWQSSHRDPMCFYKSQRWRGARWG